MEALTLSIVTAVCGENDTTRQWFETTIANARTKPEVVVVSNGSSAKEVAELAALCGEDARLTVFDDPLGSPRAFNEGLARARGDVVAMLHNDLLVLDEGWDTTVLRSFEMLRNVGIVGFHGARWLGTPDLYRAPYVLGQLARGDCWSNMVDAENHGNRASHVMEVVTLDGMALIGRREGLLQRGGMEEGLGPMHMYDHHVCLRARQAGLQNYLLPVSVQHLGGRTATRPRYNEWAKSVGYPEGDSDVHRESHRIFYDMWAGTGQLPARVS